MTADALAGAVGAAAAEELAKALERIEHCLEQLNDDQIWWRARPDLNSIGNLVLHLGGNLRQWIVSGLGGTPDDRNRPAEFAERGPIPRGELFDRLRAVVGAAQGVLHRLSADELTRVRHIQEFDVTGLGAIFDSVPHFRGHTQEIIHLTRLQLGDAYRFAWMPSAVSTPDAPGERARG